MSIFYFSREPGEIEEAIALSRTDLNGREIIEKSADYNRFVSE